LSSDASEKKNHLSCVERETGPSTILSAFRSIQFVGSRDRGESGIETSDDETSRADIGK